MNAMTVPVYVTFDVPIIGCRTTERLDVPLNDHPLETLRRALRDLYRISGISPATMTVAVPATLDGALRIDPYVTQRCAPFGTVVLTYGTLANLLGVAATTLADSFAGKSPKDYPESCPMLRDDGGFGPANFSAKV